MHLEQPAILQMTQHFDYRPSASDYNVKCFSEYSNSCFHLLNHLELVVLVIIMADYNRSAKYKKWLQSVHYVQSIGKKIMYLLLSAKQE